MNIYFTSDLHLDVSKLPVRIDIPFYGGILLIAGDTGEARNFAYMSDLRRICAAFDEVYAITGNHEYYNEKIEYAEQNIRNDTKDISNFTLLQNGVVKLGKYHLITNTLWMDVNKKDPVEINKIARGMNDFALISIKDRENMMVPGYRTFHPTDAIRIHEKHKKFIEKEVALYDNCIVMTHHAPILEHANLQGYDGGLMYGYASNMTKFILDNTDKIPYWIHGHTHDHHMTLVGNTKVITHARGYEYTPFEPQLLQLD
ncbi:MAG: hypothetical protein E4H07_05000 [Nitrosomonadales bacterium]|nr:MAG: hypothetical protein E4H07_05000 [Nitrosomonadales bacterium]